MRSGSFSPISNSLDSVQLACESKTDYYGVYKKESDIHGNNGRKWDFLDSKLGGKLLSVIFVLGVVDAEGRSTLESMIKF